MYGNGGARGKVGVAFDFAKLRATLNRTLQADGVMLEHGGTLLRQMFSITMAWSSTWTGPRIAPARRIRSRTPI